jgi:type I restriction-modification system DNA methylase subunit
LHLIDRKALLDDLKKLVTKLEKDLRERCEENTEVDARVRIEYEKAKEAKRTAQAYTVWRDEWITQVAVAWVLGVVFVRFIEDNGLIAAPFIAGLGERLQFAKEQRTAFFQQNPTQSDREYLEHVFREVAKLPSMKELYDERHNPLWALGVSGDGAKLILDQFQKIDPGTGTLVHDFSDPELGTRFLGDLYQDLSEAARKKYALLQTPEFVEEFILDRTLDPAIAEFGLEAVRIIDPTCGSGHFVLGAFARLLRMLEERDAATNRTVLAQRALDAVYGVDLNPYAIAISRFRLLLAAMKASGVKRLKDAPAFAMNLATGDSLFHGKRFSAERGVQQHLDPAEDPLRHVYMTEDAVALRGILGQQYHAVVGNPPYITVKDKALNDAYRQKYGSCSGKYSLSVPFMERFFELALAKREDHAPGFVGQITSNSFMKREFGAKLIEKFIPTWDLTHVIDTSDADIPGHTTPTVILFGRNQMPASDRIRAVMGIRGEPTAPADPAEGRVWTAITAQVDHAGSTSEWVSVTDSPRSAFHEHPWSIGGGGASELKELIQEHAEKRLGEIAESIGITSFTLEDDIYILPFAAARRRGMTEKQVRPMLVGDEIRDWVVSESDVVVFPYDEEFRPIANDPTDSRLRYLWIGRTVLSNNVMFGGQTKVASGLNWYEFGRLTSHKLRTPLSIAYAEVATHNHFVLDRGGKVFKQTAPVIKLPFQATEDDHLALLGLLNSSTACFWLKQVAYPKATVTGDISTVKGKPEANRYAFAAGCVEALPVPKTEAVRRIGRIAKRIDEIARECDLLEPRFLFEQSAEEELTRRKLASVEKVCAHLNGQMISLQEELDWECYRAFGLTENGADQAVLNDPPASKPEHRPFLWERGTPDDLPKNLRLIYGRRRAVLLENPELKLIETAVFKRPWLGRRGVFGHQTASWWDRAMEAAREKLTDLLEHNASDGTTTTASLARKVSSDRRFLELAHALKGTADFDVETLVQQLIVRDAVPMLPAARYKDSGLRIRSIWDEVWACQRREDAGESVGPVPVPPKYTSSDFKSAAYWSLRGKLDVPKERFISFPGCERESDPSLPILWAGYDHLQQAKAIAAYYQDLKENEAAPPAKLGKLLACILELLPWLKQWHNDVDPEYGARMSDFFESFLHAEMAGLGLTMDDLRRIRGL